MEHNIYNELNKNKEVKKRNEQNNLKMIFFNKNNVFQQQQQKKPINSSLTQKEIKNNRKLEIA